MGNSVSWETELWNYVEVGDSLFCPIFTICSLKKTGEHCSCSNWNYFPVVSKVPDNNHLTPNQPLLMKDLEQLPCHNTNISFAEIIKPGRIDELIELLSLHWLKRLKIKQPPVPSELISQFASTDDIAVRILPLKACHGAVWRLNASSWVIYLNSRDTNREQRITLFHEAFHMLAHQKSNITYRTKTKQTRAFSEYLADNFSLKFLMPRQWLKDDWKKTPDVKLIAKKYKVPRNAVQSRLKELKLFIIGIIMILAWNSYNLWNLLGC